MKRRIETLRDIPILILIATLADVVFFLVVV